MKLCSAGSGQVPARSSVFVHVRSDSESQRGDDAADMPTENL